MKYERIYENLKYLEAIGIFTHDEAEEKIKKLAKRHANEIDSYENLYADRYQLNSEDIPPEFNCEQRAECMMDMWYLGYHF